MRPRTEDPSVQFLQQRESTGTLTIGALPHSYDGSSYYRIWLPFRHLENGHHITGVAQPETASNITARQAAEFDVVAIQRPAGKQGLKLLETLAGHTRLVYELDDDMLQVDPSGLPHLYDESARQSIRRCLRMCDAVTTTNEHLGDVVRPYNSNIHILPNYVKQDLLDLHRPRRDRLTIGWAGGTSHLVDMVTIQDVLCNVLDRHPDVDMHWMGFDFSPLVRRPCRWTMWERDVGHYYKKVDFDIAIAPSADIPFNRSKTAIRALEMGALGIPVVAANRLPYSEFVVDGKTGFLVNTDDEWFLRLRQLINDEACRAELGANAKAQAADWTIEGNWHRWETAYEQIAKGGE